MAFTFIFFCTSLGKSGSVHLISAHPHQPPRSKQPDYFKSVSNLCQCIIRILLRAITPAWKWCRDIGLKRIGRLLSVDFTANWIFFFACCVGAQCNRLGWFRFVVWVAPEAYSTKDNGEPNGGFIKRDNGKMTTTRKRSTHKKTLWYKKHSHFVGLE